MIKMLIDLMKIINGLFIIHYLGISVLSDIPRPRGVSQSAASLYQPADKFQCLDGTLNINFSQVNDDYCDCPDGSDEPGTAACSNGKFFCENINHRSKEIPSTWVNDGICDCCDGSDEYASKARCVNNCEELGADERQRNKEKAELSKRGSLIRTEMSTKGKQMKEGHSTRLTELEQSIQQANDLKLERQQIKQSAESLESAALEIYKQAAEEEKKRQQEQADTQNRQEAEETFKKFDSNSDEVIDMSELQTRVQFDSNRDGQVSEDEAKYFLDHHDQVDFETFATLCWPRMKPYLMLDAGLFKPPKTVDEVTPDQASEPHHGGDEDSGEHAELAQDEDVETFDEEEETGEGDVEQVDTNEPSTSDQPQYDEETTRLIEAANEARNQFDQAERELRELESERKQIEDMLNKDYGTHEEFAVLNGECFNFEDREYVYKLCPFDRAVQQQKNGGAETR